MGSRCDDSPDSKLFGRKSRLFGRKQKYPSFWWRRFVSVDEFGIVEIILWWLLITTDVLLSSRFMNCNGRWIAVITDDILSSRFEDCGGEQPNSFGLCGDLCGIIVNLHKRHHSFGSGFSSDITSDGPVGNVADNWWVRWKLATRKLRRLSGRERQGCLRFLEERAKLPKEKDNQQPLEKGTEAASSLLLAVTEETRVLSPVSQVLLGANISPSTSDFAQSNGLSLSKKQERAIAARRWFEIRHKKIKSTGANSPTQLESTVDGAVVVCSASVSMSIPVSKRFTVDSWRRVGDGECAVE